MVLSDPAASRRRRSAAAGPVSSCCPLAAALLLVLLILRCCPLFLILLLVLLLRLLLLVLRRLLGLLAQRSSCWRSVGQSAALRIALLAAVDGGERVVDDAGARARPCGALGCEAKAIVSVASRA